LTLQQLLYFRTAATLGSFNAAARALHCTQPAVSEQVRRLERELGVSLFARAGRGLTLTAAGRTFLARAERVGEAADDALASVGHGHTAREQQVTVGTFRNAPYYGIADLAARFCAAHPDVRLRLRGQNSFDVARAVQDGELEAGLVVLPVDDSLLEVQALFRDEVVYLSREPGAGPVAITEVAAAPLILYDISYGFNDPTRRQLAARAQQAGVAIEPRIEVEHVETALQLVAQGMGATIAARAALAAAPAGAGISARSFVEPFHDFFALVTRRGVRVSPGTRALLQFVAAWAEEAAGRVTAP
jgi:DNA-binding transcriptional LysR family regulator